MKLVTHALRIQQSFAALNALLCQRRSARWTLAGLLTVHTLLLAYSAYVHSPTLNEPGHLVAGLSHWRFGRFEVYRVNPPLVKMVAALPVMAVGYEEDWSSFYEGPGARPEMAMGEDFVAANGERSFFLFMIARWACIPFSWIGAITCYLWARDLYGRPAGLLAAALWCFEPNILAHGSLMTPDIGGTALGVAACYTFWRWLKNPTWTQAALTGVVLGLAELAKTTLILFYPLWPLMWIVYRMGNAECGRRSRDSIPHSAFRTPHSFLREAAMLALRMLIGLYILNLGYAFEGTATQLKDFHFVSDLFTGKNGQEPRVESREPDNPQAQRHSRDVGNPDQSFIPHSAIRTPHSVNRFSNTWLGHLPVPLPKNYLLGIDLQQKDFEHYGRPSYLRGEWRDTGWWYYYLYAALIKVPLGLWMLALLALVMTLVKTTHSEFPVASLAAAKDSSIPHSAIRIPHWKDSFILLTPAVVIFTVASMKCGFSEHFRYVLPCFPFVFIWIGRVASCGFRVPSEEK